MFTTTPRFRFVINGRTCRIMLNAPKTCTRKIVSQSRGSMSTVRLRPKIPALFTRTSMCPKRSTVVSTIFRQASKSPTSPATASTWPAGPSAFATRCSVSLSLLALIATRPPPSASIDAIARPIPREDPVTIATESRISKCLTSSGAQDRPGQACCAAFGLQRDLPPAVHAHATPGVLEQSLRYRIALEHDAVPRRDREDVCRHRGEFLLGDLDQVKPGVFEGPPERDGEETWVHHGQVVVEEADEGHEVEARLRTSVIGERHRLDPDAHLAEDPPELAEPLRVRPEALAHRQDVVIEPEQVAALRGRGRPQPPDDGHAHLLERFADGVLFATAELLPHPQDDRALIRHDHRVVDEDRIREARQRRIVRPDVDAGGAQQVDEPVVFGPGLLEIRLARVAPCARILDRERIVGSADSDDPQRVGHALRSVGRGHVTPNEEKPRGSYAF